MNPVVFVLIGTAVFGTIAAFVVPRFGRPPREPLESGEPEWTDSPKGASGSPPPPPPEPTPDVLIDLDLRLAENFALREFVRSTKAEQLGIDNTPPDTVVAALQSLALSVLQPIRDELRTAIVITSAYRTPELNVAVGGSPTSQHPRGEAADIKATGRTSGELMRRLWNAKKRGMEVDQVILYHPSRGGHVHVSHTRRRENRGQFLYAPEGRSDYRPYRP